MEAVQALALIASGVAIATSVGSLGVSLYVAMRDRAHLKLDSSFGFVALGPELASAHTQITVINDGRYAEIVTGVGFLAAGGQKVQLVRPENFPDGRMPPCSLVPGDSLIAIVPRLRLREQWREAGLGRMVGVWAETRSGRKYTDEPNRWVAEHILSDEPEDE